MKRILFPVFLAGAVVFCVSCLPEDWDAVMFRREPYPETELLNYVEHVKSQPLDFQIPADDDAEEADALLSLGRGAAERGYVRPTLDGSEVLEVTEGRHPVVEAMLPAGSGGFVPNDLRVASGEPGGEARYEPQILVITGPNMAGKSTVLRQAALIALMAQAGSFVPARRARVGQVDRIFTRVGASDDLARGRSTFMVEMTEAAAILHNATRRSLVVLDEIGRGTSTFDGLSIAWAVAEHLHDAVGCRTLFATHYHELQDLARERPAVRNLTVAGKRGS